MKDRGEGWFASRFGRLPTGLKMLLILSLGLLPLGILAVLATIDSARDNRSKGEVEARAVLAVTTQRLSSNIARSSITIRAASEAIAATPPASGVCQRTLERLAGFQPSPARYALYAADNVLRCATEGFAPPPLPPAEGASSRVYVSEDGNLLRLVLYNGEGELEGVSEYSREALIDLADLPDMRGGYDLELVQEGRSIVLRDDYRGAPLARRVTASQPLAGGRLELLIRAGAMPITPSELLMILLPVMMWIAAAVIGWLIVDRLLLRPLGRMQKVISAYQPGDRAIDLPTVRSPAREIGELGQAFDEVTRTVARHEADLEAAIDRQTRLVREVHHRVKNNLQVVASLLNLHSRGSPNEEVAAAYASIQRRVDALAVVHRNHYAELEENRGVALKALISELGANLRATAPPAATAMQIRLDIEPFHTSQDAAVSVAFLVTEIVEFSMLCGAPAVWITLEGAGPGTSKLTIGSAALADGEGKDEALFGRFDRIVTGLARQLRSTLERDLERGRYSVKVAVVDKAEG